MPHTLVNPDELHDPRTFGYSHIALAVGETVHIAGQYASGGEGAVAAEGFDSQVELALENLGVALAAVGLGYGEVVRLGTYIVDHDPAKLGIVAARISGIWGSRPPAQTLVGVAALAMPGMLFEVDAVAVRG
ncbi:Endoribonuclease L-PSP [Streptomonospora litoralis]|uniref:Endoribonuclease L-PSP n=2 Tax=Streptomonospora litoralis TaxID=2498135 RepID=A0A4P6Q7R6_9ACTN|nr:Rid family hydrolase [Streptomonospora litoralis]QBI55024.1 Endoribonuclease L-PSP [Streptomonospora litoralis]